MAFSAAEVRQVAVLPPELASQIAAGEVVERPASAVKELVENALDAGATRCDVEIEGGGITLIRVRDDGHGMNEGDARLSVARHATSKLRSFEDLRAIASYGFRGEALPSIASVSRFTLRTRPHGDGDGVEVSIQGTAPPELRPVSLAPGTIVEVRDLFYNVPARRKFLRSSGTEAGHVAETIESVALARPEVTLTLARDGRRVREFLRASCRGDRVLGHDPELIPCSGERGPLSVEAFLSRPEHARTGAAGLKLIVNGRAVRDRALALSVAQAYGSVLERGRYPRGVIYLDLPHELVDVNAHPQKTEVRFADPRAVNDAVYGVLARALAAALSTPQPSRSRWGRGPERPATGPVPRPTASSGAPATSNEASAGEQAASDGGGDRRTHDPWGLGPPEPPEFSAKPLPAASSAAAGSELTTDARGLAATDAGRTAEKELPERAYARPLHASDTERPRLPLAVHDSTTAPLRPRPEVEWSSLRFLAQLRQTYLVCEGRDGIYVLDQHAAAERVNFHKLRKAYLEQQVASQSLLFPLMLELSEEEVTVFEQHAEEIARVGLDVRVRGTRAVSVQAVPRLLQRASPERLIRDLLSEISRAGGRGFSDAIDLTLARMACHGSIRAGDPLTAEEAVALLSALDGAEFAGFCPHGRPVVAFTSWGELERKVGRR